MRESPSTCQNHILKRMAFQASIALQPAAPNPFMRPEATEHHLDHCQKQARLPVLTHALYPRPIHMRPSSTTHFTLSPYEPPSTRGFHLGRISNADHSQSTLKTCPSARIKNPSP